MSYSRWCFSNWYVYPNVSGWIECDLSANGPFLQWTKDITYDEFKNIVNKQVTDVSLAKELFSILEENMKDIQAFFEEIKNKQRRF